AAAVPVQPIGGECLRVACADDERGEDECECLKRAAPCAAVLDVRVGSHGPTLGPSPNRSVMAHQRSANGAYPPASEGATKVTRARVSDSRTAGGRRRRRA